MNQDLAGKYQGHPSIRQQSEPKVEKLKSKFPEYLR
jgi:hypothetical protein